MNNINKILKFVLESYSYDNEYDGVMYTNCFYCGESQLDDNFRDIEKHKEDCICLLARKELMTYISSNKDLALELTNKIEQEELDFEQKESNRMDREDNGFDKKVFSLDKATLNLINRASKLPRSNNTRESLHETGEISDIEQIFRQEENILHIQNNW